MGTIADISRRVPIYSPEIYSTYESVPQEYPNPCPFLTPENLGYPRPSPYIYIKSWIYKIKIIIDSIFVLILYII